MRLISGDGQTRPVVGDIGETDQAFAGPWGRDLVLTYIVTSDGASEWEVEAYDSDLEPLETATNQTLQRTGAAVKRSWFQRLFGRGPGR
jgi:hypothetical protein